MAWTDRNAAGRAARLTLAILVLIGAAMLAQPAAAAGASVEIHSRLCPVAYTGNDLFKDCHEKPQAGVQYKLGPLTDTTRANGNAVFYELRSGTVSVLQTNQPVEGSWVIICSDAKDQTVPASYREIAGGISLDLLATSQVVCDWYTIPTNPWDGGGSQDGASITVHARLCPAGYTGNDVFGVCHPDPHANVTFSLGTLQATTGPSGNTLFYQLKAGSRDLVQAGAGRFQSYSVYCSLTDNGQRIPLTSISNGVRINLTVGAQVICDWYSVPAPGAELVPNTLEIHTLKCPAGYNGDALFRDCHGSPLKGVGYRVAGPLGYERSATSDSQGVVTFPSLLPGFAYTQLTMPPGIAKYIVYCAGTDGGAVPFTYIVKGFEVELPVTPPVVCDVYLIPQ